MSSSCKLPGSGRAAWQELPTSPSSASHAGSGGRQWQSSARRDTASRRHLGSTEWAQGSWQPHRDQHTNATATTSLLFPEEYKKQRPLCLPVKAQVLAFDPRNLASISTRADPLGATGTPTLPQHAMAGGAGLDGGWNCRSSRAQPQLPTAAT